MEKKVTFNGSFNDGGFYATAVFIAKTLKNTDFDQEVDGFQEVFNDIEFGLYGTRREVKVQVIKNKVILHITYNYDTDFKIEENWDDIVKKDAENIIAQLEVRISNVD